MLGGKTSFNKKLIGKHSMNVAQRRQRANSRSIYRIYTRYPMQRWWTSHPAGCWLCLGEFLCVCVCVRKSQVMWFYEHHETARHPLTHSLAPNLADKCSPTWSWASKRTGHTKHANKNIYYVICMFIYIYIYMCMCMCVCWRYMCVT